MYTTEYFGKYPMKEIHLSFCFRLPQDQLTIDGAPNFRQVKLHLLKRWRYYATLNELFCLFKGTRLFGFWDRTTYKTWFHQCS